MAIRLAKHGLLAQVAALACFLVCAPWPFATSWLARYRAAAGSAACGYVANFENTGVFVNAIILNSIANLDLDTRKICEVKWMRKSSNGEVDKKDLGESNG